MEFDHMVVQNVCHPCGGDGVIHGVEVSTFCESIHNIENSSADMSLLIYQFWELCDEICGDDLPGSSRDIVGL
jgi:hypothetical protein